MSANRSFRSLQVTKGGIQKARIALTNKAISQVQLSKDLSVTRATIGNFFSGRAVDRQIFVQICQTLDLDWQEICGQKEANALEPDNQSPPTDIDALVQEVRQKCKDDTQTRCGTMRVLNMSYPIGLGDIYTNVNILEKLSKNLRYNSPEELVEKCGGFDNFDRFGLGRIIQEKVPGLQAVGKYSKLMILGKPGAGKTTFLKHLAMQCSTGNLLADRVPIFISLKEFAESARQLSLLDFIAAQWANCGISDRTLAAKLLDVGRVLILLDGLDEVREADSHRILQEIKDASTRFRNSNFVVTCRIAAKEYIFEQFTEVEVADFDESQIADFAHKWFTKKEVTATSFIDKLNENEPIKELATNPLLLTLLCLVFGESQNFPEKVWQLYQEALEILLQRFDEQRWDEVLERRYESIYGILHPKTREELFTYIAYSSFKENNYFFDIDYAEKSIEEFLSRLRDPQIDINQLKIDKFLKSIEVQHGLLIERARKIYSFSHLTFHEYFTARSIVGNADEQTRKSALQDLATHVTEKRWREVFLMVVGMSLSSDYLLKLMKQQIDGLLTRDPKLQEFLAWVWKKSNSIEQKYKSTATRAFYFTLDIALDLHLILTSNLDIDRPSNLDLDLAPTSDNVVASDLDFALTSDRVLASALKVTREIEVALASDCFNLIFCLDCNLNLALSAALFFDRDRINHDSKHYQVLQALNDCLPDSICNQIRKQWWEGNGKKWIEEFRKALIEYRDIGHDWQFSDAQKILLWRYYYANKLLVKCLNSNCSVSEPVRQEIEDTLLLPIAEIENYKCRSKMPGD